jgi:serine/threonine protein kinase
MTNSVPANNDSQPPEDEAQDHTRLTVGGHTDNVTNKAFISDNKLAPGTMVGGDYEVLSLLGVGGMGFVYKVRHRLLGKVYAMKTISPEQLNDVSWRRLQVEAQAIARISHPNIVGIANLGMHEGRLPFYVMDLLEGENLADILSRGPLSLAEALPIFIEICAGLGYAHRKGIVHRDIKPGNIFILSKPDHSGRVKLVDFGIAKLSGLKNPGEQALTSMGEVFGSPLYMSPEQCEGKKIDARSDIYSLGCTFFEVLTGITPFRGKNPVQTMLMHQKQPPPLLSSASKGKVVSEAMENVITTMLAKKPMDRYPNLEKVAEDLLKVQRGEEVLNSPFTKTIKLKNLDDKPEVIGKNGNSNELNHPSKALLMSLALGTMIATGLIFLAASYFTGDSSKKTPEPRPQTQASTKEASPREESIAIGSYSRHYRDHGSEFIEFSFPGNQSLGDLYIESKGQTIEKIPATGRQLVRIPTKPKIGLEASEFLIDNLQYLRGFAPNDLNALNVSYSHDLEEPLTTIDGPVKKCTAHKLSEVLQNIAHLSELRELAVEASGAAKGKDSNESVHLLDKLTKLRSLDLNLCNITGGQLATCRCIKNLEELYFSQNDDVAPLVRALAGNDNLKALYLEGMSPPGLGPEEFAVIGQLKSLRKLDISLTVINERSLKALTPALALRRLEFTTEALSPDCTAALLRMPALKNVSVTVLRHVPSELTYSKLLKARGIELSIKD